MNTTIDINKVKAAVERYAPGRITVKDRPKKGIPADAGRRKILRSLGYSCPGFSHFNR